MDLVECVRVSWGYFEGNWKTVVGNLNKFNKETNWYVLGTTANLGNNNNLYFSHLIM